MTNHDEKGDTLIIKKDKKRLFKAGIIFFIWLIAIFYIGSNVSKSSVEHAKENPKIEKSKNPTGEGISDDKKTPEQKAAAEKLLVINQKTTTNDMNKLSSALNLTKDGWEESGSKQEDGIPILKVYFPKGQNIKAWREALVLRAFVNIKIKDAPTTVYHIYEEWLKEQVPDLKIEKTEDKSGTAFSGYSESGKFFISGKVFSGSLKETIFITQYIIKNDNKDDVTTKAQAWGRTLSQIQ